MNQLFDCFPLKGEDLLQPVLYKGNRHTGVVRDYGSDGPLAHDELYVLLLPYDTPRLRLLIDDGVFREVRKVPWVYYSPEVLLLQDDEATSGCPFLSTRKVPNATTSAAHTKMTIRMITLRRSSLELEATLSLNNRK